MGKYISAIYYSDILTFFRACYSGILFGIYSYILFAMCADILSGILPGIYSDILPDIYSGILSSMLPGIYSDILSGILSGIQVGKNCIGYSTQSVKQQTQWQPGRKLLVKFDFLWTQTPPRI